MDYHNQAALDAWMDQDLAQIRNQEIWQEHKKAKDGSGDMCYVYKEKDEPVWWFKLVAIMSEATVEQARDMLDKSLIERADEWNQVAGTGKIVEKVNENTIVYHFVYKPTMFLLSPRELLYVKTCRDLDNGGFLITYRSIDHEDVPPSKDNVRMEQKSSHLIEPRPEGGIIFTYMMHLDSKVPAMISNKTAGVTMKELSARRKALKNPILSKS